MSRRLPFVLLGGLLVALASPPPAVAAPATVELRIEGKARTLYEGRVTTDLRAVDLGDGTGPHPCDGTDNPATPVPGPTRGGAFMTAAQGPGGFGFTGAYSFDMTFTVIAGDSVAYDAGTGEFLAEYKNGQFASFGSCGDQIATGDRLLYAYATGSEQLLELSGPATVAPGAPAALKVTDAGSGLAVAGATVGGETSGADGVAVVTLAAAGPATFKATKAGAIRSNAVSVCATSGSDGACGTAVATVASSADCATSGHDGRCGTRDTTAPGATLLGIRDGQRFARGKGPRRLRWALDGEPGELHAIKLRLTRSDRGRCTYFSGTFERFRVPRGNRCGAGNGFWFAVGGGAALDYVLPRALPRGRYVLDINVIDRAFNRDDARRRGANRVVFHVG